MKPYVVIVENSAKAQTFRDILDDKYEIISIGGIIKRIPSAKRNSGWGFEDNISGKLDDIVASSQHRKRIYVSTDDDENGEKSAWDILEYMMIDNAFRITPNNLSEKAIISAIASARSIDKKAIDAYVTKSVIDRFVGKDVNKMLRWFFRQNELASEEIVNNLGIGRVSAGALSLIVKAEEKIDTFIAEYYRRVGANYFFNNVQFKAKNKLKFTRDKKEELMVFLDAARKSTHIIEKYKQDTKNVLPPQPLNAAWLQRSINTIYLFEPKYTMKIAKQLYEGIDIDGKNVGLITFYKSDGIYIPDNSFYEIYERLNSICSRDYVYSKKRIYKGGEEGNSEAIRPISFSDEYTPQRLESIGCLNDDQMKVYKYIYERTLASQMSAAIYDNSEIVIDAGGAKLSARANSRIFDGWMLLGDGWLKAGDTEMEEEEEIVCLPEGLYVTQKIDPIEVFDYEIKERAPWRYGDGRFVTTIENYNIANGSFVSEITNFLRERGLIRKISNMLHPTELGKQVYYFLEQYAPWIIDIEMIGKLHQDIELIKNGKKDKKEVILEYQNYLNETKLQLEYSEEDEIPEQWMREKALKIAQYRNQTLTEQVLHDKKRLMAYINAHKDEVIEYHGKCPKCQNGDIYEFDHGFKCNNKACSFILWYNNIERFFNAFSKNIKQENYHKYIQIVLSKGKVFIDNLYSKKKEAFFNSYICLGYNEQYNNWNFSFCGSQEGEEANTEKNSEEKVEDYTPNISSKDVADSKMEKLQKENEILQQKLIQEKEERRLIQDESKKDTLTRAFNRKCFNEDILSLFKSFLRVLFFQNRYHQQ